MIGCTCPHTPDYHRRHPAATAWHCGACANCGTGRVLHTSSTYRAGTAKTQDEHTFTVCDCTGENKG